MIFDRTLNATVDPGMASGASGMPSSGGMGGGSEMGGAGSSPTPEPGPKPKPGAEAKEGEGQDKPPPKEADQVMVEKGASMALQSQGCPNPPADQIGEKVGQAYKQMKDKMDPGKKAGEIADAAGKVISKMSEEEGGPGEGKEGPQTAEAAIAAQDMIKLMAEIGTDLSQAGDKVKKMGASSQAGAEQGAGSPGGEDPKKGAGAAPSGPKPGMSDTSMGGG